MYGIDVVKQQTRCWRKFAIALAFFLAIAFLCFTGVKFALVTYAFDQAKEVRSREVGVLVSNGGTIAQVDLASLFAVDDGRLVLRKTDQTCSNKTCHGGIRAHTKRWPSYPYHRGNRGRKSQMQNER